MKDAVFIPNILTVKELAPKLIPLTDMEIEPITVALTKMAHSG